MTSVANESRRMIQVINPATEEVATEIAVNDEKDCDAAVAAAATAQREWAALPGARRGELLWKWAELVEASAAEIAPLDVNCTGKVFNDAWGEAFFAARHARFWAGKADKIFGQQLADVPGRFSYTRLEPLGVYVVILPWNSPAHSFMARVSPPLACGNAVIIKPSELSPLSAQRLAELAADAGMPAGLVQVLTGDGSTGAALSAHPGVAGVSFTGSVPTGRRIAHAAADTFKKLTLEMGGKSPIIVFEDADLDSAARAVVLGILTNAGQICAGSSKLLVHRSIADSFVSEVRNRMSQVKVGDPTSRETQIGPIVSRNQYEKVRGFLAQAESDGARVSSCGSAEQVGGKGFFVAPTVIDQVEPGMSVAREEIFGPVLSVMTFENEAEAVTLANDSDYGLSSYVWTRDVGRLFRMTEAIEAGVVHGNSPLAMDPSLPFGGFKHSGLGGAYADDALAGCTRTKRVTLRIAAEPLTTYWPGV